MRNTPPGPPTNGVVEKCIERAVALQPSPQGDLNRIAATTPAGPPRVITEVMAMRAAFADPSGAAPRRTHAS